MSGRLSSRVRAVVVAVAAVALGCAQSTWWEEEAQRQRATTPLLWHAEAPEPAAGSFYLLGSVHIGTLRMMDLGPEVDAAYRSSEELVVEVDVSKVDAQEVASLTQRFGVVEPPLTLRDMISEETHAKLDAYLTARGNSVSQVEHYKPWFVAMMVLQLEFQAAGYEAELGVDRLFLDRAGGSKPVVGLETIESQLGMMDGLPAALQEMMLRDVLARIDGFAQEAVEMIQAWREGDEERLAEVVFSPLEAHPELRVFYDAVFFRRNDAMTERLVELARDGKSRFVVVGAGHLVGERGVPAQLAERGFAVRQIAGRPDRTSPSP